MPNPLVFSKSIVGALAAELPGFRCTLRQSGRDAAWVRVTGELDFATAPQLEQTLRKAELRARRLREPFHDDRRSERPVWVVRGRSRRSPWFSTHPPSGRRHRQLQ